MRTSAISGEVSDQTGGLLAGASVTVRNKDTGAKRTLATDHLGRYRAAFLELGEYEVTASFPGFGAGQKNGVLLELDREAVVNLRLSLTGATDQVTVSSEAELVETSASAVTSLVDGRKIVDLPLNGRDYVSLATLQAGVQIARAQSRDVNTGHGIQLSMAGSRPVQNNFRLDGVSLTSQTGSTPGSINGVNLGVDAIREFSLLASTYSAQYGRAAGGVINAVTRSGTNDLHGTLFYFHRNDNLDARNFFDGREPPEFRRHQFGGSAGGPAARNRTFLFGNYESLRELRGNTTLNTTLSSAARGGQLKTGTVAVNPAIASLLELYPEPNGEVFGDTGLFIFPNNWDAREHFATSRLDHILTSSDNLFLRYTIDDASRMNETDYRISQRRNRTRSQSVALEQSHVFSARSVNSLRLGFARSFDVRDETHARVPGGDDPGLAFLPGHQEIGIVTVTGLTSFPGGSGALDSDRAAFNSFQLNQDLTWAGSRSSLVFGGALERTRFNMNSQSVQSGEYRFQSLADFLANRPDRFRAQLPGSDTVRGFRQWIFAWYLQDKIRMGSRLTLDLGLRHEWATVPTEVNGKMANLDELTSPATRVGGSLYQNPSFDNFAPRLGVAWDVFGGGRTVARGGYGIFYDQLLSQFLLLAGLRNPPFYLAADVRQLQAGDFPKNGFRQLISRPTLDLRAERLPRDINQPYVQHWNFNIRQKLGGEAILRLAYLGAHGVHLSTIVEDANLVQPTLLPDGRLYFPAAGAKLNPSFGQIRNRPFNGHSFYQALQAGLEKRWSRGFQFQVSYAWAKSIDDNSSTFARTDGVNSIGIPIDGNHRFNRGLSCFDVRQGFAFHSTWDIPSPGGPALRRVAGGWRLGSIATVSSGLPFSATLGYDAARTKTARPDYRGGQRPDLRPGASDDPVTGNPQRWVDPAGFSRPVDGFLGNLGRNTLSGAGLINVDVVLHKEFRAPLLGEAGRLDLRLEAYNLLNHTNFDLPESSRMQVFTATSIPEDFGRITSAGFSRELQIEVKVIF
jgi:hypothetical protein